MNLQPTLDAAIVLSAIIISVIGTIVILRNHPKRYLYLWGVSAGSAELVCYLHIRIGFYSFPFRLFPQISIMPFMALLTAFPFYVLFSTRYGPEKFMWRIPFLWLLVHIGVSLELYAAVFTSIIRYKFAWDIFDSYTTWWIYMLVLDYIGMRIIPRNARRPIRASSFQYGKPFWFLLHFVLIVSIFMFGFYTGKVSP